MTLFADYLERGAELAPFRVGLVVERDVARVAVRVQFPERDQMVSWWLPVVVPKTQDDKFLWLPDEGEQVVCLMDEHDEAGVVLGAIYSAADSAPVESTEKFHVAFKDGTKAEYDRESHVMRVDYADEATIKYDADAHFFQFSFPDDTVVEYDADAHVLLLDFSDGAVIKYDAETHQFEVTLADEGKARIDAPGGIELKSSGQIELSDDTAGVLLKSGGAEVRVEPGGVSIVPPLPITSTVAQT
ncbi:MAG: phage baseplate assembly protein V [Candidatus Binataceae bacterium]